MGNASSINKINYEDLNFLSNNNECILINTLPSTMQECLIVNTVNINEEISLINSYLKTDQKKTIIIYGKNCNDESIYKKYKQLNDLGFININIYTGGMFEWLLLQDIYGNDEFKTTKRELDILKYRPDSKLNKLYLTN